MAGVDILPEIAWRRAIVEVCPDAAVAIETELPDEFTVDPEFPFVAAVRVNVYPYDPVVLVVRYDPADSTYSVALPWDGADGFAVDEIAEALGEWVEIGLGR